MQCSRDLPANGLSCLLLIRCKHLLPCVPSVFDKVGGESPLTNQNKASRKFLGWTILYENYCFKKGIAKGCTDMIPAEWGFSLERLREFLPEV